MFLGAVSLCASLLVACDPEIVEAPRYQDLPTESAGGEAPPSQEAMTFLERAMVLIQQDQCQRAIDEALLPALDRFEAQYPADRPLPTASRRADARGSAAGPEWSDAMYLHAFCLVEVGRADEASRWLERALTRIPSDVVYSCELGHIRQGQGRMPDALTIFQGALENARGLRESGAIGQQLLFGQPLDWWERRALRGIGYTQYELGDMAAAEAAYRAALAIDPNDERALRELQLIATRRGAI